MDLVHTWAPGKSWPEYKQISYGISIELEVLTSCNSRRPPVQGLLPLDSCPWFEAWEVDISWLLRVISVDLLHDIYLSVCSVYFRGVWSWAVKKLVGKKILIYEEELEKVRKWCDFEAEARLEEN